MTPKSEKPGLKKHMSRLAFGAYVPWHMCYIALIVALQTVVGEGLLREYYGDFPPHPIFLLECSVFVWKDELQGPIVQLFKIRSYGIFHCYDFVWHQHIIIAWSHVLLNSCSK